MTPGAFGIFPLSQEPGDAQVTNPIMSMDRKTGANRHPIPGTPGLHAVVTRPGAAIGSPARGAATTIAGPVGAATSATNGFAVSGGSRP